MKPRAPIDKLLQAYLDGELSPADEEQVRQRLREDPRLERQWRALHDMQEWMLAKRAEEPESTKRLSAELLAAMAAKPKSPPQGKGHRAAPFRLALAGAIAVILIALLLPSEHWVLTHRPARTKTSISQDASSGCPASASKIPYRFCLQAPAASEVCVVGDFNDWTVCSNPLSRSQNGFWCLSLPLEPGPHEYLFVVDGKWMPDPREPLRRTDGFGGENSVASVRGAPA